MELYEQQEYRGYKINIYYDSDAESPREWNNVATFVCEHPRYTLGDRQDIESCVNELFSKHVTSKAVIDYFIKSRKAVVINNPDYDPDRKCNRMWCWHEDAYNMKYMWSENGLTQEIYFNSDYDTDNVIAGEMEDELSVGEKLELCEMADALVYLPISMYEHSGITLWLGSRMAHYDAQWDCSSLGFAYVEKETAEHEKPKGINWKDYAYKQMEAEMSEYDDYCRGNVYGYNVTDENNEAVSEIDGCWGFIGDDGKKQLIDEAEAEINYLIREKAEKRNSNIRTIITNIHQLAGQQFISADTSIRIGKDMFGQDTIEAASIISSNVKCYDSIRLDELDDELLENMASLIKIA